MTGVTIERRLAGFRAAREAGPRADAEELAGRRRAADLAAERLAASVGGIVERSGAGSLVRITSGPHRIPVERDRLAALPGQPPAGVQLVCLDTETTGLATATGTIAFLVGLGWWDVDEFVTTQLLLPDHADEPALLAALGAHIADDAWLVTYNGRGFDWPLLTTRYRMHRHEAPAHAGHLDLLPFVRRVFRHRMPDARLRTVERDLLGVHRVGDVEGWEIPGRYLEVLRGGPADLLSDVVRHNAEDVRSLARLIAHIGDGLADRSTWTVAPAGDLAGLGRAYRLAGRLDESLACLDAALDRASATPPPRPAAAAREAAPTPWWLSPAEVPWGRPARENLGPARLGDAWTEQRLFVERAHVLRRIGRMEEAADSWVAAAAGPGRFAVLAWLEIAKLRERHLGDLAGALAATERARAALDRRRRLALPEPRLEQVVALRRERLLRRVARSSGADRQSPGAATLRV